MGLAGKADQVGSPWGKSASGLSLLAWLPHRPLISVMQQLPALSSEGTCTDACPSIWDLEVAVEIQPL